MREEVKMCWRKSRQIWYFCLFVLVSSNDIVLKKCVLVWFIFVGEPKVEKQKMMVHLKKR